MFPLPYPIPLCISTSQSAVGKLFNHPHFAEVETEAEEWKANSLMSPNKLLLEMGTEPCFLESQLSVPST